MRVRVGFRCWLPQRYLTVHFDGGFVHVLDVMAWLYARVMGGPNARRPPDRSTVVLNCAALGSITVTDDGQPRDTQLLEASVAGRPVAPWGVLLDGQTVVFKRTPYELAPPGPFEPQPDVGDVLNIRAFAKRQEVVHLWERRHTRTMDRRARQPPPGVKRRVMARGIPQIDLRPPVDEREAEHAMVNPIGGALVVLKSAEEKAADVRMGRHMRYCPVK